MKRGYLAGALSLILVLLSGCAVSDSGRDILREEQLSGINSETIPESVEESAAISPKEDIRTGLADPSAGDTVSGMEDNTVITEEILEQCREEFDYRAGFERAPSREEMDVLYQRFLDSGLMEREEMRLTGVAAGDYDGNGCAVLVVCLYSLV